MVALSAGMTVPPIIRCSVPDCDWGFETTDSGRMDQCYEAYKRHCVEMYDAGSESYIQLDLEKLMLNLVK